MAPFFPLLLCMDHRLVNTGDAFLGVCSSVRNPAAVPKGPFLFLGRFTVT